MTRRIKKLKSKIRYEKLFISPFLVCETSEMKIKVRLSFRSFSACVFLDLILALNAYDCYCLLLSVIVLAVLLQIRSNFERWGSREKREQRNYISFHFAA